MNNQEERAALYLARAVQADEVGARCMDPLAKEAWRLIAQSYRDLTRYPVRTLH